MLGTIIFLSDPGIYSQFFFFSYPRNLTQRPQQHAERDAGPSMRNLRYDQREVGVHI